MFEFQVYDKEKKRNSLVNKSLILWKDVYEERLDEYGNANFWSWSYTLGGWKP